jgi:hypothetical protein
LDFEVALPKEVPNKSFLISLIWAKYEAHNLQRSRRMVVRL